MTDVSINVLFNKKVHRFLVEPNLTAGDLLRYIRKFYQVSMFTALEIRIDDKYVPPDQTIFRICLNQEAFRIECIQRKYFNCC